MKSIRINVSKEKLREMTGIEDAIAYTVTPDGTEIILRAPDYSQSRLIKLESTDSLNISP